MNGNAGGQSSNNSYGKNTGGGPSVWKQKDYGADGRVRGTPAQEKSGVNAKGLNMKTPLTAATNSGSRFDILNDDVDVAMMDSGGQASYKHATEVQNTEKVAFIDITNQSSTSKVPAKNPSQSSKKAVKKGKKKLQSEKVKAIWEEVAMAVAVAAEEVKAIWEVIPCSRFTRRRKRKVAYKLFAGTIMVGINMLDMFVQDSTSDIIIQRGDHDHHSSLFVQRLLPYTPQRQALIISVFSFVIPFRNY
ncbi:hypothetical protein LWI29_033935 [Acer saccharum]|uniref:Uncharacterized protein n=1 Tax=Acer saccharum TaxID=4024 RepID=A0AA39W5Z4_ACESA|nr:hypothetical protein LWI29_033935 [Acer saccharum]